MLLSAGLVDFGGGAKGCLLRFGREDRRQRNVDGIAEHSSIAGCDGDLLESCTPSRGARPDGGVSKRRMASKPAQVRSSSVPRPAPFLLFSRRRSNDCRGWSERERCDPGLLRDCSTLSSSRSLLLRFSPRTCAHELAARCTSVIVSRRTPSMLVAMSDESTRGDSQASEATGAK